MKGLARVFKTINNKYFIFAVSAVLLITLIYSFLAGKVSWWQFAVLLISSGIFLMILYNFDTIKKIQERKDDILKLEKIHTESIIKIDELNKIRSEAKDILQSLLPKLISSKIEVEQASEKAEHASEKKEKTLATKKKSLKKSRSKVKTEDRKPGQPRKKIEAEKEVDEKEVPEKMTFSQMVRQRNKINK